MIINRFHLSPSMVYRQSLEDLLEPYEDGYRTYSVISNPDWRLRFESSAPWKATFRWAVGENKTRVQGIEVTGSDAQDFVESVRGLLSGLGEGTLELPAAGRWKYEGGEIVRRTTEIKVNIDVESAFNGASASVEDLQQAFEAVASQFIGQPMTRETADALSERLYETRRRFEDIERAVMSPRSGGTMGDDSSDDDA